MLIPHYMVCCSTSGRWHFRQRTPSDIQKVLGCKIIKKTLRTKDVVKARLRATILAEGYSRLFDFLRDYRIERISKQDADLIIFRTTSPSNIMKHSALQISPKQFPEITSIETSDIFDLETQWRQNDLTNSLAPPRIETLSLNKAQVAWLATLKMSCLPKTYTIKKAAIVSLVKFLGENTNVYSITRSDLARWYQKMREEGSSTPTLMNKQSYIGGKGGFFDWAIASGYYHGEDNPASSHINYSVREKRLRRKFGFKSYDAEQILAIFSPHALATLPLEARWAALIGLYTGARASEVGQLLVENFILDEDISCIKISDEGLHQKLKTEASLRTIPLHPHLISLGILDWVNIKRCEGYDRIFSATKSDVKNGAGNWITKSFGRYLSQVGKEWPTAKRGFHSLRKTFIQLLQGAGTVSELRSQIVGHEIDDEHHTIYSRKFTNHEKLNGLGEYSPGLKILDYGIDIHNIRKSLWGTTLKV